MKKITMIAGFIGLVSLLSLAKPAQANVFDDVRNGFTNIRNRVEDRKENRQDQREDRRDDRQDKREDFKEQFASKSASRMAKFKSRVAFGNGVLTAINGTTLTVGKDDKTYTVLTGEFEKCTTKFRRRFWGNSGLSEYTVGDELNISGRFQDEAKTIIEACVIRDVSIQKRFGVFIGEVISLSSNGWVMKTIGVKRENQMVTISSSTQLVNRRGETIAQGDILAGHRVRVKGLWNRVNNTVTEVAHVKDYNLPVVTITPTVTPTP